MANKGYGLEREVEVAMVRLADQKLDSPLYERCHRITSSGAHRSEKGDVRTVGIPFLTRQLLFECKRRKDARKKGQVVTLEWEWMRKVREEAEAINHTPVVVYSFYNARDNRKHIVVPRDYLVGLNLPLCDTIAIESTKKKHNFVVYKSMVDEIDTEKISGSLFFATEDNGWFGYTWNHFMRQLEELKASWKTLQNL
jgi:hypothetical protein